MGLGGSRFVGCRHRRGIVVFTIFCVMRKKCATRVVPSIAGTKCMYILRKTHTKNDNLPTDTGWLLIRVAGDVFLHV